MVYKCRNSWPPQYLCDTFNANHNIHNHKVKPKPCECNRLACITLDINDNYKILIINGYMRNVNYRVNDIDAEFDETVDYIEQMCKLL